MTYRDDLSTPRGARRPTYNPEAFGAFAEGFARFLGTGRYLAVQTVMVAVWIAFNLIAIRYRFDPYPFILLNLMFSTQAAYAAPLILLAQNRQADRDRIQAERDREINARSIAATDFLAREVADIRIALAGKVDRDDLEEATNRILEELDRHASNARLEALTTSRLDEL